MDSKLSASRRADCSSGNEKRTNDICDHEMAPPTWEEVAGYYIWNKTKDLYPGSKGSTEGIMKGMKRMHFNDGGGEDDGHKAKKQLHGVSQTYQNFGLHLICNSDRGIAQAATKTEDLEMGQSYELDDRRYRRVG
jgi:hypothetical protein